MVCKDCGQVIEEGKAFCKACGASAPADAAVAAAALEHTMVRPSAADAPTVVTPPAGPAKAAVTPPSPPPSLKTAPPPPPPPAFNTPAPPPPHPAAGYSPAWQPPQGPTGQRGRGGLIAGIVAAAVIVLAGAGVGVYFGFIRDGDDGVTSTSGTTTKTTLAGSSTTATSVTSSSSARTTSTAIGAGTTQTIPGLTTSTSATTTTTEDVTTTYLMATDAMVAQLEGDDERIPELAAQINNTAPKVPTWIRDELETMLDDLDVGNEELAELDVPAGFEDSDYWLGEAITHMANRVYATIQGIEAMWDTGKVSSSTPFFNEGRTERDEYRKALQKYHDFLPID